MVDVTAEKSAGNSFRKTIMGRTPSLIKSKFLSVLDSSNGILNGISSKFEGLSLSSSAETTGEPEEDDEQIYRPQRYPLKTKPSSERTDTESELEDIVIEFEARKLKERRAHEEIRSGRYKHPNIVTKMADGFNVLDYKNKVKTAASTAASVLSSPSTESKSTSLPVIDVIAPSDDNLTAVQKVQSLKSDAISSFSASEYDLCVPTSLSCESSDMKLWMRSESINSVFSWASTFSLDDGSDEPVLEFMRKFIAILFENPDGISLELKAEFGHMARTEVGRLWFSRLVNAQRVKSKKVEESTFYSLIQYFAIVLFECHECEDFSPAKSLMNMCFTFYHEISVPGIEPYHEYLYIYLRDQPIWHSLRFWNAAFFDALQCERANRPVPKTKLSPKSGAAHRDSTSSKQENEEAEIVERSNSEDDDDDEEERDLVKVERRMTQEELDKKLMEIDDDQRYQQNITFGQLGTFTCNMHAFGLSKSMCLEFLRKQCTIANLSQEHEKLLNDNINRMYRETDKWRK